MRGRCQFNAFNPRFGFALSSTEAVTDTESLQPSLGNNKHQMTATPSNRACAKWRSFLSAIKWDIVYTCPAELINQKGKTGAMIRDDRPGVNTTRTGR